MTNMYDGVIGNCQLEVSVLNCPWKRCHPQSKFQLGDKEIRKGPTKANLSLKMPDKRIKFEKIISERIKINFLSTQMLMANTMSCF